MNVWKVGTLDQLVGLSDDLGKLDNYVEQACHVQFESYLVIFICNIVKLFYN